MKSLFLLLLSSLKLGKLATTAGTMLLSLVAYAGIWGWRYAAGFIGLLFLHEMGHYIAARQRGLSVGAPTFIPFVGAWINLESQLLDVETEAYVGMGGPVLGSIGALCVYLWARHVDSQLLLAISYSGFFLNLLNLLPVSPLDGGRITAVLSPRVWLIGVPIMLALMLYWPSPMLALVAMLALPQLAKAWQYDANAPENIAYYGAPTTVKLEYGAGYLGLSGLLAVMTFEVHDMLSAVRM
ncbi:site-2 protease family protein [Methylocystis hirsuta]|uniref:Site-2 protease family protein n=2 Tax=Methylocystis hirsuta TaxID=369798 RepID=A0A3M9XPX8_9HYPH|nr:site-2 protease family protein [Methylocystis hirsuta]